MQNANSGKESIEINIQKKEVPFGAVSVPNPATQNQRWNVGYLSSMDWSRTRTTNVPKSIANVIGFRRSSSGMHCEKKTMLEGFTAGSSGGGWK